MPSNGAYFVAQSVRFLGGEGEEGGVLNILYTLTPGFLGTGNSARRKASS